MNRTEAEMNSLTQSAKEVALQSAKTASNVISFGVIGSRLRKKEEKEYTSMVSWSKEVEAGRGAFPYSEETGLSLIDLENEKNYIELQDHWRIDTSRTKHIVSTAINGVSGTVKEWVSDGDVVMTLYVQILDNVYEDYPKDDVMALMDMLRKNKTIKIANSYLNDVVGITRAVVSSWKYSPKMWDCAQEIVVDLISDETFIIEEQILGE